jgi:hypothetical protein
MDYFYDKVHLLRPSDEKIGDVDIKKSIWRGLPAGFQLCFEYDDIQGLSLETIGNRSLKRTHHSERPGLPIKVRKSI